MGGSAKLKTYLLLAAFSLTMFSTASAKIVYVDTDATGASDGTSWEDAYNFLQDALADANSASKPVEIRVAQGIYTPDSSSANPNGSGDREATLHLINGVTLKGGYAGFGEPNPNARDIQLYETILTGDLDADDGPDFANRGENSFHVVTGSGTDTNAVLDGFTVIGGQANGSYSNNTDKGGGVYGGSPVLLNCTLTNNYASWGGGVAGWGILADCMFIANSANSGGGMYGGGSLTNCTFISNSARIDGGGINSGDWDAWLTGCTFRRNSAGQWGGAMYICDNAGIATLINCFLEENSAGWAGGGVFVYQGGVELIDCILHGNSANQGGAVASEGSYSRLIDCTFTGNSASQSGGAVWTGGGSMIMKSCSVTDNSAEQGGGISTYGELILINSRLTGNCASQSGGGLCSLCGDLCLNNCTFAGNSAERGHAMTFNPSEQWCSTSSQLANCILWDDGYEIWNNDYSAEITIAHSDIQGGPAAVYDPCNIIIWGDGNIDIDPCFADPGYWDPNGTPEDVNDDFWVDGDYHLLPGSPCIDAGDPNYIAEPNETDLDGRQRIIGGRIDMGAYEYSPPIQAEVRIVPRTINLASKGKWIICYIRFGEGCDVADIDSNSLLLENEIEPQWVWFDEEEQVAMVRFSRGEVQDILTIGQVGLTITGHLTDGTIFEAKDVIIVINKGGRKSAKQEKAK